jgi:inorganic pyrophosphatase
MKWTKKPVPCSSIASCPPLSEDGDPVDVLVVTPVALITGVVVRCRPVGMLKMTDEAGVDAKILAVPVDKLCSLYKDIQKPDDLSSLLLRQISHFFEHYKDLEPNKWVKVEGWVDADAAKAEIMAGVARYQQASPKPNF